jgi:trimethyllysine dioxygenase
MKDTAYTTLALPAHTDTTYFTDPAGLQLFHLLSHDGTGGASLLVDGFACAAQMRSSHPEAYDILSRVPVPWHASGNEGVVITPAAWVPVFTLDAEGGVRQLRWNNDDRASMPVEVAEGVAYEEWFEAARVWNSIITDKKNEYWEQLVPGRPVSAFILILFCPFVREDWLTVGCSL